MTADTTGGWRTTLAEIEQAIGECLAALDRYEVTFAQAIAGEAELISSIVGPQPAGTAWADKLQSADEAVIAVERLLDEQEAIWGRWRAALAEWRHAAAASPRPGETTVGPAATVNQEVTGEPALSTRMQPWPASQ